MIIKEYQCLSCGAKTGCSNEEPSPPPHKVRWRVGRKVPPNVYDGDRPVCQTHNDVDARLIVEAVNKLQSEPDWHALYTDSETKLYHEQEVRAELEEALRQRDKRIAELSVWLQSCSHEISIEAMRGTEP